MAPKTEAAGASSPVRGLSPGRIFLLLVLFRVALSLFVVVTADVPDEWWQSTEVAYSFVFGKGALTWEWREGIRSFIYPLPFYVMFLLLRAIGLDTPYMVWALPRVFTGVVAAGIDWLTYRVASSRFGAETASMALLFSVLNWFNGFIGVRTQSNVVETLVLLVCALSVGDLLWFLFFAGMGVALRVTFILPAAPLYVAAVAQTRKTPAGSRKVLLSNTWPYVVGVSVAFVGLWLMLIAAIDRMFYGYWICTPLEFLMFNVFRGLSALFGTHPFHWYVSQGVPAMLFTMTIPLLFLPFTPLRQRVGVPPMRERPPAGIYTNAWLLGSIATFTIAGYSWLPHKEFRFVYPVLPLLIILSALAATRHPWLQMRRRALVALLAVTNLIMFVIFAQLFQRGTIDVMNYLRNRADNPLDTVDVLAGCHQTPGYSYVHKRVRVLRGMDCDVVVSPVTGLRQPTQHLAFLTHPAAFVSWAYSGIEPQGGTNSTEVAMLLRDVVPRGGSWPVPDAIIVYSHYAELIAEPFLGKYGFQLERKFFHTFFPLENHMDTSLELWVRPISVRP